MREVWARLHAVQCSLSQSLVTPTLAQVVSTSLFTSTCTSPSLSFPSSPCTPATPQRGASWLTTTPSHSQVISSTTRSSTTRSPASSLTSRIPSSTLLRHQTRTWMTWHSASYSLKYTEITPITAVRKVYVSVRRQCLSWSIERGNLWKRGTLISFFECQKHVQCSQSVSCNHSNSIERGNLWKRWLLRSVKAPVHRLGLCSMNKDERSSQIVARKFLITISKQLEQNKNAQFYKKNYCGNNRIFVKFINKILLRWRNYENSWVLPSICSPDRSSSRIRTLLWNYLEDYKNCKMKWIVWTILRISRTLNRYAVEIPTLPVNRCYSLNILLLTDYWGLHSYRRDAKKPPDVWDTSGISGNFFTNPQASSSAPYPQELNFTWRKTIEPLHIAEKSGIPERDQDLRCQSGPSAKDSVIFSGGDSSKNYGQTNNDCRSWISTLTSSLRQQPLLAGR